MSQYKKVAILLQNSFWTSNGNNMRNNVISIRLRNELNRPLVNFEYPYQLVINFYSAGPSYFADQTQFMGGINIKGEIDYQYGWQGVMLDENTIMWKNDGSIWKRTVAPRITHNNMYDTQSIRAKDAAMTNYLFNKYQRAYGVKPGLPGL
jgi:hypothetical protein